jgi:two-component system, LuxR family, response regulator FixJ
MEGYKPVVYVVDDDDAVRAALCALLESVHLPAQDFKSAEDFLQAADPGMSGCLLLDVRMPGMSGLELQRILKERGFGLPVIIITGHGDVPSAVRAMKSGATDFVEKPFNEQDLLDRIHASLEQDAEAFSRRRERQAAAQRFGKLTPREREVLELLANGQASKRIAATLGISERTVDVHRFNIMRKSGVRSLAELIQLWSMSQHLAGERRQ